MERQRFTAEFKREAVRLMERGDKPVAQLAPKTGSGSLIPVPAIGWVGRLMRGARTGEGKAGKG